MAELEEEPHHVKFNEEQDNFVKHNRITIQKLSELKLQVHLGFLKLNHTYEIVVPLEIPNHIDNINWITNDSCLGAYSSIKTCENLGDKLNLHFVMKAAKPKLMSEKVKLSSPTDPTLHLEIVLLARVLGKGQGTPMLKDGIHCVAVEVDEESEASDWQGFD